MAQDPGYPGNLLKQDQLNTPYGGEAENNFGGKAWKFLHGWVRDIADWFLQHVRQDMDIQAPVVQTTVVVGDLLAHDLSRTAAGGRPWIDKLSNAVVGKAIFLGVAMDNVTAGLRCKMTTHGPVPANVTLLNPAVLTGAPTNITFDRVANRFKVAGGGDPVVAIADAQGNINLFAPGRTAALV